MEERKRASILEERKRASSNVPSIISADLKIVGDLKSNGDIQIDGSVEGFVRGGLVIVGERAKVKGTIVAETVQIFGTVSGQVRAATVCLHKTAVVTGDVAHEALTIEAGAYFEGQVKPPESTEPRKAAEA